MHADNGGGYERFDYVDSSFVEQSIKATTCVPANEFEGYTDTIVLQSLPNMLHIGERAFFQGGDANSIIILNFGNEDASSSPLEVVAAEAFHEFKGTVRLQSLPALREIGKWAFRGTGDTGLSNQAALVDLSDSTLLCSISTEAFFEFAGIVRMNVAACPGSATPVIPTKPAITTKLPQTQPPKMEVAEIVEALDKIEASLAALFEPADDRGEETNAKPNDANVKAYRENPANECQNAKEMVGTCMVQ
jgi:hypothetical protein